MIRLIIQVVGNHPATNREEVLAQLESSEFASDIASAQIRDALQVAVAKIAGSGLEALRPWAPEVSLALTALDETCRAALHLDMQTTRDLAEAGASLDFDPYV